MSRSQRLLALLQLLRNHKKPVSAKTLADKLDVSVRSIYRDIETLNAQGADIQGEAGIGFILKDGYMLPPLMFTQDEIEALVLGSRWVKAYGDEALMTSAKQALSKIHAVSSSNIKREIDTHTLFVPNFENNQAHQLPFAKEIRTSIREQKKIQIRYEDVKGDISDRDICPFALAFFGTHQVVASWCELRQDYRHFRVDRILELIQTNEVYTPNKQTHIAKWRAVQCIQHDFDDF